MRIVRRLAASFLFLTTLMFTTATVHAEATETAPPFGVQHKIIVIDAGHGGPDSGARTLGGVYEKDVTLAIAKQLKALFDEAGAHVYLTRSFDHDFATDEDQARGRRHQTDLRNRTRTINSKHPDAVISIHCNSVPSAQWSGAHTIYMTGNTQSQHFAKLMQVRFKEILLPTRREADDMNTLYLLKRVKAPMVLAEVGFLSNPSECAALQSKKYQQTVAMALYLATLDYFQNPSPPSK